jgi:hypothetical protein
LRRVWDDVLRVADPRSAAGCCALPPTSTSEFGLNAATNKNAEVDFSASTLMFLFAYDLWQHCLQPASSLQHLAHLVSSLQQLPSQAMAELAQALSLWQQVEQPVVISIPAAKTAANISIVFI